MAKDRFSIRVQAVLQIFDCLTYRPVNKAYLRFIIENHGKILPKEDGIFVVIGEEKPEMLRIESPIYGSMTVALSDTKAEQPLHLWAEPRRGYHLVPDLYWLQAKGEPFAKIFAFAEKEEAKIRLLEEAKAGSSTLKLYQERKHTFNGAHALLYDPTNAEAAELVHMQDFTEEGCMLSKPLQKDHKKIKTGIFLLPHGTADEDGNCEIAVRKQDTPYILFDTEGRKIVELTF